MPQLQGVPQLGLVGKINLDLVDIRVGIGTAK
ncbi:hypothetical protein NK6_2602 [Bradyrhizobium diazoefficiens]|uniref:Uncharacterized protein n=1 Tax=Bradyrhizobium diazoefficiens TaxID=1355477 RepID=A0A0E4BMB5_9BRAD|nr:hypothetical protein NK6_2602 [Bradyrhizobium diazoefficiens]